MQLSSPPTLVQLGQNSKTALPMPNLHEAVLSLTTQMPTLHVVSGKVIARPQVPSWFSQSIPQGRNKRSNSNFH